MAIKLIRGTTYKALCEINTLNKIITFGDKNIIYLNISELYESCNNDCKRELEKIFNTESNRQKINKLNIYKSMSEASGLKGKELGIVTDAYMKIYLNTGNIDKDIYIIGYNDVIYI